MRHILIFTIFLLSFFTTGCNADLNQKFYGQQQLSETTQLVESFTINQVVPCVLDNEASIGPVTDSIFTDPCVSTPTATTVSIKEASDTKALMDITDCEKLPGPWLKCFMLVKTESNSEVRWISVPAIVRPTNLSRTDTYHLTVKNIGTSPYEDPIRILVNIDN